MLTRYSYVLCNLISELRSLPLPRPNHCSAKRARNENFSVTLSQSEKFRSVKTFDS